MLEHLPDIAKNGVEIDKIDPQPAIQKGAETASDWEYREDAKYLYDKAKGLRGRLIDPIARIDREQLPDPIIGFKDLRNYKALAEYLIIRDELGLSCRINFNTAHYVETNGKRTWKWGRWAQLETLAHEYIHLWQQQVGSGKPSHGKEFIDKCEEIGLHPMPGVGCHTTVADEPFSILMAEWGLKRPGDVPRDDRKVDWFINPGDLKKRKGKSTLAKWTCGCQNARIGTKEFCATCNKPECGNVFVLADGLTHTIYEGERIRE